MIRQSISLTTPNDNWLNAQVGNDKEYSSKSELVNDLIRKARAYHEKIEAIRSKLIEAEQSGFTILTPAKILAKSKAELRKNGEL